MLRVPIVSCNDGSLPFLAAEWHWSEQARLIGAAARRARRQAASQRWTSSAWAAHTASSLSIAVSQQYMLLLNECINESVNNAFSTE